MPLLEFWKSSPIIVGQLNIEQIVANAGDGILKDGSPCANEFREYLSQVTSETIANYVEHCLSTSFPKAGMVLQDLVNELGRRLDYKVTNGRYQGTANAIGFDGMWRSPEGHDIVVEVKTTDAYRISLDTIAAYRRKLASSGQIGSSSSILIVVGRGDTGELEAQVRGSRHAWDMRLISADALIKLVQIKENAEGQETGLKIRSLLAPMEYTRLDAMIDVMFTAAKNVEAAVNVTESEEETEGREEQPDKLQMHVKGVWQFTEPTVLQAKRDQIVAAVADRMKTALIKKSRALFWDATHGHRLVCTISKRYARAGSYAYWYAYHPQWHDFLMQGQDSYHALGCVDLQCAFVIPVAAIDKALSGLNTTTKEDGQSYWHMHIAEMIAGSYSLLVPKQATSIDLAAYQVPLSGS